MSHHNRCADTAVGAVSPAQGPTAGRQAPADPAGERGSEENKEAGRREWVGIPMPAVVPSSMSTRSPTARSAGFHPNPGFEHPPQARASGRLRAEPIDWRGCAPGRAGNIPIAVVFAMVHGLFRETAVSPPSTLSPTGGCYANAG